LRDAEHEALAPPLLPAQLHDHGPLPLTGDAAPAVQRLAVGALARLAPLEDPHAPFTGGLEAIFVAEQVAVVPPLLPAQLHAHGPAADRRRRARDAKVGGRRADVCNPCGSAAYPIYAMRRGMLLRMRLTGNYRREEESEYCAANIAHQISPPQTGNLAIGIVKEPLTTKTVWVAPNP